MKNQVIYKVLIIGASYRGYCLARQLNKSGLKDICFLSTHFDNIPKSANLVNIECITDTATFIEYYKRLIVITLASGQKLFCERLVIATGKKSKSYLQYSKVQKLFYSLHELKKEKASGTSCIVIGSNDIAQANAEKLSRKYKHVYLCDPEARLAGRTITEKNICYLPRCDVASSKALDKNMYEATLDTYAKIQYQTILVSLDREPDIAFIPAQFIELNGKYPKVDNKFRSIRIPTLYIIGEAIEDPTNDVQTVFEDIIGEN